jgi:invasion protein IalB
MKSRRPAFFVFAAALFALLPASAQTTQSQPQQPLTANESKNVGDWLVRCFPVKSATPCDMLYILAVKSSGQVMLSMRIADVPAKDKHVMIIGVPLGVSFAKGIVVTTDGGATAPLQFQRCDREGCYVQTVLDDNAIDALARSSASNTNVKFAGYNGRAFSLPFPLKGFAEARDTMDQLSKGRVAAESKD